MPATNVSDQWKFPRSTEEEPMPIAKMTYVSTEVNPIDPEEAA